ncbi:hypothetical protein [Caulobacter soli]|uniref:hypothetical protein n=1 Tax=Caulobacter soli TaxID=2708539 RepID=UPI0013ECDA8B|nr:hypothetical protein [Caulobacter soli]
MRGLRTFMLILLAAVFAVSGPLRALPCHAEPSAPPPCHEMMQDMTGDMAGMTHDKAPVHKSRSDAMPLSCCAGCLPASVRDVAPVLAPGAVVRIAFTPLRQAAVGLSLAPEHGPPRPVA